MRVSKETMAEHREKIIESAAARFRERGFDGISVADLMNEAGLTHGGFYGHFSSKEELMELASARAMEKAAARWEKVMNASVEEPVKAFVEYYLSQQHRDRPGSGCLFAALGTDIARQPVSLRKVVTDGVQKLFGILARVTPGATKAARRKKAIATFASLLGGVVLARITDDPELFQEILRAVAASAANGA
jgi:TetR/AcrR family transcriptional repressor of nem operon